MLNEIVDIENEKGELDVEEEDEGTESSDDTKKQDSPKSFLDSLNLDVPSSYEVEPSMYLFFFQY